MDSFFYFQGEPMLSSQVERMKHHSRFYKRYARRLKNEGKIQKLRTAKYDKMLLDEHITQITDVIYERK